MIGRTNAKAKRAPAGKPDFPGWRTTDEQEIERRRVRATVENITVEPIEVKGGFYGDFAAQSATGKRPYRVEIRSLLTTDNSCDCADFRGNGLGTCKHVEAVLNHLRRKGKTAFAQAATGGSPYVEVFVSRKTNHEIRVLRPKQMRPKLHDLLASFFADDGALLADPIEAIPSLKRALERMPADSRSTVRIGRDVLEQVDDLVRRRERDLSKEAFLKEAKSGRRTLNVVNAKLYPYQQEGMLHLAFNERALLADEMGLGKTVQAIAACELLRQTRRIERVLVVSPASLKTEWEEQIAKFVGQPARLVMGPRGARLQQYRDGAFFYLTNYEQVVSDVDDINRIMAPDVVILDEAQRIKNWQTRTAKTIKRLASPFAFVLTGTPLENRIDEVYSIVEFLDPAIFGPLFRFNRDFYELDERGRPVGFKNLDTLNKRLRPIMLRRRKDEVEEQLPPRTVKNFFVGMEPEQRARYAEYNDKVARIVSITKRRPLMKEEFEKLQRYLACMRMICDTPYILDPETKICPKLSELANLLEDVMQTGNSKVIIFSEWERMLHLVRDLVSEMKLSFAWHTGSVPQQKRRLEINRFKQDPDCRLFISTDSGATGLNLQAANVVINLDLPWNPAKWEQRIARAWRKHQTRSVEVINIICEDSIEHRMLTMLSQKQQLADGVLDGRGDLASIKMPSGRVALMEKLEALMGAPAPAPAPRAAAPEVARPVAVDPLERFRQDMVARMGNRLLGLESYTQPNGEISVLAVVDDAPDQVKPLAERLLGESYEKHEKPPALELLDRHAFEAIQRLARAGILKIDAGKAKALFAAPSVTTPAEDERQRLRKLAQQMMAGTQRKLKLSAHLHDGGFAAEALPSLAESVELALRALSCLVGKEPEASGPPVALGFLQEELMSNKLAGASDVSFVGCLRESVKDVSGISESAARSLFQSGRAFMDRAEQAVAKASLS